MDDADELDFAVRGVVRDGKIVLDAPLDAPDGTFVTVSPYRNGDIPGLTEWKPLTEEQMRWHREDVKYLRALAARRESGRGDAA